MAWWSRWETVYVRRQTKLEIVKAVIELERRGYECKAPIREVKTDGKRYNKTNNNGFIRRKFESNFDQTYYEVYMKKVEVATE